MKGFVILATIAFALVTHVESKAPYQVSIILNDSKTSGTNASQYYLCNGIIIHEMYILTTANCLYIPVMNTNFSAKLMANDITVVAGLRNSSNSTLYRNVVSIIPHHKFNKTTYDNDIAVLKLDMALPLANNTETQWLDIATSRDAVGTSGSCFATVFNSSQENEGLYSISKRPSNLQHSICADINDTALIREMDLCLEYFMSNSMQCNISSISLKYSNDRGTAYVCNNKLVGLLADVNPPKNVEKCILNQQTTAYYINVTMYLDWLLETTEEVQFDKNRTVIPPPSIPSWVSPTESPVLPPTHPSTSKPNAAARHFCSSIYLIALLMNIFMFVAKFA
ncbi:trypsin eta-like [Chironomus tepperi]|uniref:trypsin eta-like n=1 Tax=Chironomus tepperi TaxID=113505 RepID=UPI00391F9ABD